MCLTKGVLEMASVVPKASLAKSGAASVRGRGAEHNPKNRFERLELTFGPETWAAEDEAPGQQTKFYKDTSKTVLARNESPDIGYNVSLNPYRGCEHGCIYCYARPTHEYLGFSLGLDFESKIMVKKDAPALLRRELAAPSWQPQPVGMGGVTDIYQPVERKLELTRRCLEVFLDFRNPVTLVTKSHLITRDLDLLQELSAFGAVSVAVSLTTLDEDLWRVMEPRAASPTRRLDAVRKLAAAGVHVGVLTSPIIPGLNDAEIPQLIGAAVDAGAQFAGYGLVHLPYGLKDLFAGWVEATFPDRAGKILNRIRELRGGKLNDPRFGYRMRGEGPFADQIASLHRLACRRAGLPKPGFRLATEHFRVPGRSTQPGLFE